MRARVVCGCRPPSAPRYPTRAVSRPLRATARLAQRRRISPARLRREQPARKSRKESAGKGDGIGRRDCVGAGRQMPGIDALRRRIERRRRIGLASRSPSASTAQPSRKAISAEGIARGETASAARMQPRASAVAISRASTGVQRATAPSTSASGVSRPMRWIMAVSAFMLAFVTKPPYWVKRLKWLRFGSASERA